MGNRNSRPKPKTRKINCNKYINESNNWKKNYYNMRNQMIYWKNKNNSLIKELRILKEICGNSNNIKSKARQIYNLLENSYLSKINLIQIQQSLLNQQNKNVEIKNNIIDKNKLQIRENKDSINTKKRLIQYNLKEFNKKIYINQKLKILLAILCIIVLIILAYNKYKK